MTRDFGRYSYGVAAICFGVLTLYWHDVSIWLPFQVPGSAPYREPVAYAVFTIAIVGGITVQWRRTAQIGAVVLGTLFLVFALFYVPPIVQAPLTFDSWGNFFEKFSIFVGALVAYGAVSSSNHRWALRTAAIGQTLFGICVATFAIYQIVGFQFTKDLVPNWLPPGRTFWVNATTIAFALAAVAILSGRQALLASRCLTAMLLLFGLLIWLPALFVDFSRSNLIENVTNLATAASAWILADYLTKKNTTASSR